jgi:hypothetical protein
MKITISMKHISIIFILIISLFLSTCANVPMGDTSQNALDWPGIYQCEFMTITLNANMTYKAWVNDVEVRAAFTWDKNGRTICLERLRPHSKCHRFLVGENKLIPMKTKRKRLKDAKILSKQ